MRKHLIAQGENENNALNLARMAMNEKYGKGWREESDTSKQKYEDYSPTEYDEHLHGEHWVD